MRIGVVSDTHMPRFGEALPRALVRGLTRAGVERIVHCGDFTDLRIVELFEAIAPFDAVAGNNDGEPIRARFGRKKILTFDDVRIGVVHGDGKAKSTLQRAVDAFRDERVDAILFGHSHRPLCRRMGDVLLLNPGSPTDKRLNPFYSFGVLEIENGAVRGRVHYYLRRDG